MKIEVFHIQEPTDFEGSEAFRDVVCFGPSKLKNSSSSFTFLKVHEFKFTSGDSNTNLESVFCQTQNITDQWKEGHRSSMVGDIFKVTFKSGASVCFIVDKVGFEPVPLTDIDNLVFVEKLVGGVK